MKILKMTHGLGAGQLLRYSKVWKFAHNLHENPQKLLSGRGDCLSVFDCVRIPGDVLPATCVGELTSFEPCCRPTEVHATKELLTVSGHDTIATFSEM